MDILFIAGASMDQILEVSRLPESDEKLLVKNVGYLPGGMIANAATAASKLGAQCGWIGWLGNDEAGRVLHRSFQDANVNVANVRWLDGMMSDLCVIMLEPGGERTILVANSLPDTPPMDDAIAHDLRVTKLAYTMPRPVAWFEQFASEVHAGGGKIAVDLESSTPVTGEELLRVLSFADIVFTNLGGLAVVQPDLDYEDVARQLLSVGPSEIVVTHGSRGSIVFTNNERTEFPIYPVHVVDSTGAGDMFHSAYMVAMLQHKPIIERQRFASAAAALKIQYLGARGGQPSQDEVTLFIKTHPE